MVIRKRLAPLLALLVSAFSLASAQQAPPVDDYIHHAWDSLTRSMSECKSVADTKLARASVLYLPAGYPERPEVKALETQCHVQVRYLPHPINRIGDIKPHEIPDAGLLYLPNKYVVPGGRFNEMYGWDSYFIVLGLLQDHRLDLARGMVENFFFEIQYYGAILNANRTYYFTRSQPPFLSSMIRAVYDTYIAEGKTKDAADWLNYSYPYAVRDHTLWMSREHQAGTTGLARYYDLGDGPVEEMADDSTYYPDVIRWLLAHPKERGDYLVSGPDNPNAAQQAQLAQTSCDPHISPVCAHAHVDGHWLSRDFYKGDRAMRESGFDPSFRFGAYDGSTHHYAPVCLNALLYKYENDLAWMAETRKQMQEAAHWRGDAAARKSAINKYLWNAQKGMYFDYDFVAGRQSSYHYIATFYPLWAGVADAEQAKAVESHLNLFERPGGLAMSDVESGVQWDLPYGWAPTNWIAADGLAKAGDLADAVRISRRFTTMVRNNYQCDQTIREKYDVVTASTQVNVASGYKMNVIGFGWTNATYLKMNALIRDAHQPETPVNVPPRACTAPAH
ncbi:trehalase family glycosidase [Silvibacterium sp.]|uniref:trehalase family glycosidase n=1 Tax=Silvibacterium sp. TaxID=1964179 RepID=UPI0039E22BB6